MDDCSNAEASKKYARWKDEERRIFIAACEAAIAEGHRPGKCFTKEGWDRVITLFNSISGHNWSKIQLRNHWDVMRREHERLTKLLSCTRVKYNPSDGRIVASEKWWNKKIKGKFDCRDHKCFSHICINSTGILRSNLQKLCYLVVAGSLGVGASFFRGCHDHHFHFATYNVPMRKASRSCLSSSCRVRSEDYRGTPSGESVLLNEQTLERELQIAIEEENYAQAAKIRDSLKLLQEDSKAFVLAASARFYNSFRNGDLASMQALWSKGDHVRIVHPGVSGISGHDLVMGSWEFVWADHDFPLEIEITDVQVHVRWDVGNVTCIEMVKTKGSSWGRQFATNVFERIDGQWFMSIHHASYVDL